MQWQANSVKKQGCISYCLSVLILLQLMFRLLNIYSAVGGGMGTIGVQLHLNCAAISLRAVSGDYGMARDSTRHYTFQWQRGTFQLKQNCRLRHLLDLVLEDEKFQLICSGRIQGRMLCL